MSNFSIDLLHDHWRRILIPQLNTRLEMWLHLPVRISIKAIGQSQENQG